MKSLARKISQNFVKDSNGTIKGVPNSNTNVNKGLKKKKSIKDMMVDTFKNPFSYLKNDNNVLPKNSNITDVKYTTFSSSEYESVFNKPIDPSTLTKSDPSRLIYVPKSIMQEADIQSDINSSIFENENTNNVNDSNTVNSKDFNNISVQVADTSDQISESSGEEEEEEKQSSESTLCSDSDNENQPSHNNNKKEVKYVFFPWNFIKSKLSFSKTEVNNFCNDNKLTSYERYENYSSDNEMADISEDETAIELQVFHPSTSDELINEKAMVPEPDYDSNHQFSI
ncbi:hypothetical protein PIROE2DRAFT_14644 [Piromyces sp. E2]|nr:hypothetical protein PIROE2DRAFT_14644 [Piromyces sp. E2]|eukprot:OUM59741.1 hypothetical protein PIROE2DRAFT_14644 [Piromyces sp. E2]